MIKRNKQGKFMKGSCMKDTRIEFSCECCGTKKKLNKKHYDRINHHFCSVKCSARWKSLNLSGKNSPYYKHGLDSKGYKVCKNQKSNTRKVHRHIMEEYLGRKLKSTEIVHHIDFDKTNNNIENLYLFESQKRHGAYHGFLKHIVYSELIDFGSWRK